MVRSVEFKDPSRVELIKAVEKLAKNENSNLWATVAKELSRVRRNRREVNVYKIDKYTASGDTIIVPGKVLGDGFLGHKVAVAAFRFTQGAEKKIKDSGGEVMSILDLMKKNPKGSKIKLMG
ncbi:MAG: 50S ribosomal protein L18e [Candidatus Altiarchaeota archaeon]|nr:50S ribosomal protein L18e [Candidatus Altiarchaeota archaeon]